MTDKTVALSDFLTTREVIDAVALYAKCEREGESFARRCAEQIMLPSNSSLPTTALP